MFRGLVGRWLRVVGVMALMLALAPLGGTPASASQGGDDHKVTLCHRTNSESNPYVVITIDKAGVFKTGHDSHDEGPVWQPGFKAAGQRWGDIIPPFTYYESPQAERDDELSEYPGLNWAEGQAIYANGCQPTTPPAPEEEQPFGELTGRCVEGEDSSTFHVSGTFDDGDVENVMWRLELSTGEPISLTSSPFDVVVDASAGTKVTLVSSTDGGATWKNEDGPVTVTECPPDEESPTTGTFTVECDADGAVVTIGSLEGPEGTTWVLRVDGVEQPVTSGQVVQVPEKSELALVSVKDGTKTTRKRATAPAACPEAGTVLKSANPATGTTVAPGSTIDYTVTVSNTGSVPLADEPVVDTLPTYVTVVAGSVSDSGVVSADGRTITWTVTLAPKASMTLTYRGLVAANAPAGASLVNEVTFLGQRSTTTHTVGSTGLQAVKSVSPTGAARFGDTLTYTVTVTALGTLPQGNVQVSDSVPAGTTYVSGSAVCLDAGACSPTVASGVVTWALGPMQPGASRSVSFRVTIDTPASGPGGSLPAVEIVNVGSVRSDQVGPTPSNEVRTQVAAVQGVKVGQPTSGGSTDSGGSGQETPDTVVQGTKTGASGGVLASTGSALPMGTMLALGGLLLLMGAALLRVSTTGGKR